MTFILPTCPQYYCTTPWPLADLICDCTFLKAERLNLHNIEGECTAIMFHQDLFCAPSGMEESERWIEHFWLWGKNRDPFQVGTTRRKITNPDLEKQSWFAERIADSHSQVTSGGHEGHFCDTILLEVFSNLKVPHPPPKSDWERGSLSGSLAHSPQLPDPLICKVCCYRPWTRIALLVALFISEWIIDVLEKGSWINAQSQNFCLRKVGCSGYLMLEKVLEGESYPAVVANSIRVLFLTCNLVNYIVKPLTHFSLNCCCWQWGEEPEFILYAFFLLSNSLEKYFMVHSHSVLKATDSLSCTPCPHAIGILKQPGSPWLQNRLSSACNRNDLWLLHQCKRSLKTIQTKGLNWR